MSDDVAVADPAATCAACDGGVGTPYSVTVGQGQRTIYYRCAACGHTWATTGPILPHPNGTPRRRRNDPPQTCDS